MDMECSEAEEKLIYDLIPKYGDRYFNLESMKYTYVDNINNPDRTYYNLFDIFVLSCVNSAIEKLQRDIEFDMLRYDRFLKLSLELESLRDKVIYLYDYDSYHRRY